MVIQLSSACALSNTKNSNRVLAFVTNFPILHRGISHTDRQSCTVRYTGYCWAKTPQLPHSTPQVEKVLGAIGVNTHSAKEVMESMGLKDKGNFLENYLYPAIELKLVEPLYPEQPKHPKPKYRLTEKGKALLK